MAQHKHFDMETDGDVTIIRLIDPTLHDMILITELHDELLEYIEQHRPRKLLIDFTCVTQCSSAVINSVLLTRKRLMNYQGVVQLCSMHPQVRQAFRILRLDGTLFQIHEALPDALRALDAS